MLHPKYSNIRKIHNAYLLYLIYLKIKNQSKVGEIQLTDALKTLATHEAIYAYDFEGRRYDVGDKLGF